MTNDSKITKKSSKRPRWLKILLLSLALIILLILFLPTLLSTAPGKALILSRVNNKISGKISAGSLSLGWFSGAKLQNIQYHDAQNKPVLAIAGINTGITVWDYLTGSTIDLNQINLTGGATPQFPDTTITLHLSGNLDLSKKLINFTADSDLTAADQKTSKINTIKFPAGSVLSFGDLANNFHAQVTYQLPLVQAFFADHLPKDTIFDGTYTVDVHVTGPFTKTGLKIDQTSIGEGRIAIAGFDVGPAQIPVNFQNGILTILPTDLPFQTGGGHLRLRGKIDLNQNPPAFIIDTPDDPDHPLIQDMDLNHKIAAGNLRFFPLFWGSVDQSGDVGKISGKVTVRINSCYLPFSSAAFKTKGALSGNLSVNDLVTDAPFFNQINQTLGGLAKITQLNFLDTSKGSIPDVAFTFADGKVAYQNLRLGSSVSNLTFSGSVGLDNSLAMNMDVGLPGINLPIPIALKGTTQKPELTLNGKLPDLSGLGKSLENVPNLFNKLLNGKNK